MRLMEYVHKDKVTNRIQRFSETSDAEKWLFYNVLQYDYRPEKQIDMVMQHYNVEREDAEKVLYNFKRKSYELGNLGSETPVIENLTGDKMKTSSRKCTQKEAVTLLNKLIKEQVMSYYTKESGKNIKKNEKLKEPTKERMATEQEKENKKQELVEALLELTHEYNTTPFMDVNEVIKKLTEVGKIISAKKATIEENMKNFKYGRKIYVHELVEMMLEKEEKPESAIETYDEEYAKKTAPEKAKEVTDEVREDGKEEPKDTEKTSDTLGKTEAAPSKPKGVKTMKEEKPLRFKSFMTGKK